MYCFSVPMPYTIEDINKILDINKETEKSKITSLYAGLPSTCEFYTGFEQSRNLMLQNSEWNYWKSLIEYTLSKNIDFIYLLNSPRPLDIENPFFVKQLEKLELLLNELRKIGVKNLRVGSVQLMSYISNHYKNFTILASTSLDYKTIWEYQNFLYFHPEVKQIIPGHDINKNFKLLKILRKKYPNIEMELMVNEACLQGCPHRTFHELIDIDKDTVINNEICLSGAFGTYFCNAVVYKYPIHSLVIGTHIFPWEIENYAKIGINKFKLVGRDAFSKNSDKCITSYLMYLKGIDNIKNVQNFAFSNFMSHLRGNETLNKITVKDFIKYMPKIKHFEKYGHLCQSRCGTECRYCYKCAEKIQKKFERRQKIQEKMSISPCRIN